MAFSALREFVDIWMMRKMLLNPRERAESAQDGQHQVDHAHGSSPDTYDASSPGAEDRSPVI